MRSRCLRGSPPPGNPGRGLAPGGRPWQPWQQAASETTKYVGVSRRVMFRREFPAIPRVSTALGLIKVFPIGDVLSGFGFKARRIEPHVTRERQGVDVSASQELHLVSFAAGATEKDFEVRVGIGL